MRPRLVAAAVAATTVLAGCASVVSSQGHSAGSGSNQPSRTAEVSPSATASASAPPAPASGAAAAHLGDPRSADLCQLVQLPAYQPFGTATFDEPQRAANCDITVAGRGGVSIGLSITAMPVGQAKPRAAGVPSVVAGLAVIGFPGDESTCQRDVWTSSVVLSLLAENVGAQGARPDQLCQAASILSGQVATAVAASAVPRRPLAGHSLVTMDMCRGVGPADLARAGGGLLTVERRYYPTFCRATSTRYTLGVQVVFRKSAAKPQRTRQVGGHVLSWFDAVGPTSIGCDVTSVQGKTSDAAITEAVDLYLLIHSAGPRGPKLCDQLAAEAPKVLSRLGLK